METKIKPAVLMLGLLALTVTLFQNCSEVRLSKLSKVDLSSAAQAGKLCISGDSKPLKNKILYVIDKSGSNKLNSDKGQGSDPNAVIRLGSIRDFLTRYIDKNSIEWGLISFQGTSSKSYINDKSGNPVFGTGLQFKSALVTFASEVDTGGTPYLSALALASKTISDDLANPENAGFTVNYQILFESDGLPTDACQSTSGCPASDAHFKAATNLENIAPGSIFLSTVYYAPPSWDDSGDAYNGLSKIAAIGHGKSLNLGQSGTNVIDISSLLNVSLSQTWALKQFQVYNLNSAMCDDGSVGVDSDSDGICDQDEIIYNTLFATNLASKFTVSNPRFDPTNRNSLNTNYSDYFAKQVLLGNSYFPECATGQTDADNDLVTDCEEAMLLNKNPTGLTPQWTQSLITAGGVGNPNSPDSDGDGFIDSISMYGFGATSAPLNYNNSTRIFATGVTGYDVLHEHRNPAKPAVFSESSYDTRLTPTGYNEAGEHCYDFDQTQLKLYPTLAISNVTQVSGNQDLLHAAGENIVLVYYIAVPENDPNTQKISYRYSYQKLSYKPNVSQPVNLDFENFRTFRVK